MLKQEINNEIVQLRKSVRQSQICVVHKLIREAKTLSNKQGPEKLVEKYKKRADKLLREVYAIRTVKVDEITKFGIANLDRLQEIIQSPNTNDKTRITAKIAKFKPLHIRLVEFKEKYPDCEELLNAKGKKKKAIAKVKTSCATDSEWEPTKSAKTASVDSELTSDEPIRKSPRVAKQKKPEIQVIDEGGAESSSDEGSNKDEDSNKDGKQNKKASKKAGKKNSSKIPGTPRLARCSIPKPISVISQQATVRPFTEILQETSAGESANTGESTSKNVDDTGSATEPSDLAATTGEVTEDDFFIGADGNAMSVRVSAPWKTGNADVPETSGFSGGSRFKKNMEEPSDRSWRTARKGSNPIQNRAQTRSRTYEGSRNVKNAPVESKNRGTRQNMESAEESANLHPSWAARKKQQEIMKQGFQGKKIVFDDN